MRGLELERVTAPQATDVTVSTPEEFAKMIAADTMRLAKVLTDAGMKPQ